MGITKIYRQLNLKKDLLVMSGVSNKLVAIQIIPPLLCASAFIYSATLFLFVDNKGFSFIIDSYRI